MSATYFPIEIRFHVASLKPRPVSRPNASASAETTVDQCRVDMPHQVQLVDDSVHQA